jgi:flavin reductase (DIM6/NTAB) family NADH-FMN oxidoreductase RutF
MEFVLEQIAVELRYKLLTALVVPRPIALVTSIDENGVYNAAPFSFFNVVSENPAIVVLGIGSKAQTEKKDTLRNIEKTGEFVVNMVDRDMLAALQTCAIDFPYGESEIEASCLTLERSRTVAVKRILNSPATLECRLFSKIDLAVGRHLVLGEVLCLHVKDEAFDTDNKRIIPEHYQPLARLYGTNYAWMGESFSMPIRSYADFKLQRKED